MAFKKIKEYNEEKFGGLFLLRNDGDSADVVFLYQSEDDALVANTHYIKSSSYSGYVHCLEQGCPACGKGIRTQTKLFIPLYNIHAQEIQFWDRTMRFENQLKHDVFENFPNPSEFVFRITRHGAAGDINTTYEITVVGKNTLKSYHEILAANSAVFPDYYENICRDVPALELSKMLSSSENDSGVHDSLPNYQVSPRVTTSAYQRPDVPPIPESDMVIDEIDPNEMLEKSDTDDEIGEVDF